MNSKKQSNKEEADQIKQIGLKAEEYVDCQQKEKRKENEEKRKKKFREMMGNNEKYLKWFANEKYTFDSEGFKYDGDKISNVMIIPLKQDTYVREEKEECIIELKGVILTSGEELPPIRIPINQVESGGWFVNPKWGLKVVFELPIQKNIQIKAIKEASKFSEKNMIFQHTGFSKIKDKFVYLLPSGAVGAEEKEKVNLGNDILNQFGFTNKEFKFNDVATVFLKCLEIAPREITVPIIAVTFTASLMSIFESLGFNVGFVTWINGTQKSNSIEITKAINSCFGSFNKKHAPLSFLDGIQSIRDKNNKLKDVPIIMEDYYISSNKNENAENKKIVEEIIALSCDRKNGVINTLNGDMIKPYRAKGLIIVTAETIPELSDKKQSNVLLMNIEEGIVKEENLREIQKKEKELQFFTKEYIKYTIKNKEIICEGILTKYNTKFLEASKELPVKTAEIITAIYIGYLNLMEFLFAKNIINEGIKNQMLEEAWNIFINLGKDQNLIIEDISPINMFENAMKKLDEAEEISTFNLKNAANITVKEVKKDGFIGYYDQENNMHLIYPELLYKAIKDYYSKQNLAFPLDMSTLYKELFNRGYLYRTEKQKRPQIRRDNPFNGKEESFIGLLEDKIHITYRYVEKGKITSK